MSSEMLRSRPWRPGSTSSACARRRPRRPGGHPRRALRAAAPGPSTPVSLTDRPDGGRLRSTVYLIFGSRTGLSTHSAPTCGGTVPGSTGGRRGRAPGRAGAPARRDRRRSPGFRRPPRRLPRAVLDGPVRPGCGRQGPCADEETGQAGWRTSPSASRSRRPCGPTSPPTRPPTSLAGDELRPFDQLYTGRKLPSTPSHALWSPPPSAASVRERSAYRDGRRSKLRCRS